MAIANTITDELQKYWLLTVLTVKVVVAHKRYNRRLELANELVNEIGRDDWAVRMGIIKRESPRKVEPPEEIKEILWLMHRFGRLQLSHFSLPSTLIRMQFLPGSPMLLQDATSTISANGRAHTASRLQIGY